ncbi:hypothetical protein B9Z19DRAFT_1137588 [Tuber borchii]|uniref:Uncharacterized protein n=1 Tax=Tuber borchii TaxID=42251 RepID=A0A2T6ZAC1_TUBBO|nr:hypothetical protein B9Z19DRAFT_1137588 [Tuber borchii]
MGLNDIKGSLDFRECASNDRANSLLSITLHHPSANQDVNNCSRKHEFPPGILTELYSELDCGYILIPPIIRTENAGPATGPNTRRFNNTAVHTDDLHPRSAFPEAPNDWVINGHAGLLEKPHNCTPGRAEEIEEIPDIEGARKEFNPTNTSGASDHAGGQYWIMAKLADTQSKEESARKRLAKKDGEIEWPEKRLAEMNAELDNSRNEMQVLGNLDSARSESISSVPSGRRFTLRVVQ